jgi:hypothetical protein
VVLLLTNSVDLLYLYQNRNIKTETAQRVNRLQLQTREINKKRQLEMMATVVRQGGTNDQHSIPCLASEARLTALREQ